MIPLDGSEAAERVIPFARNLAQQLELSVLLVRAYVAVPEAEADTAAAPLSKRTAEEYLQVHRSRLEEHGLQTQTLVKSGHPASVILDTADSNHIAYIAMTSCGHSWAERFLIGSVTEKVLRWCSTPIVVWPVGQPGHPLDDEAINVGRLLVPLDGSSAAEVILSHVVSWREKFFSQVTLLAVHGANGGYRDQGEAAEYLRNIVKRLAFPASDVSIRFLSGDPKVEILNESDRGEYSLVALSTRARSDMERWLVGSVAEKVVRHSRTPVLVARATKATQ